jgi:hypothetical protein
MSGSSRSPAALAISAAVYLPGSAAAQTRGSAALLSSLAKSRSARLAPKQMRLCARVGRKRLGRVL